jgi:hypothetical protein
MAIELETAVEDLAVGFIPFSQQIPLQNGGDCLIMNAGILLCKILAFFFYPCDWLKQTNVLRRNIKVTRAECGLVPFNVFKNPPTKENAKGNRCGEQNT